MNKAAAGNPGGRFGILAGAARAAAIVTAAAPAARLHADPVPGAFRPL
jgi:hypothetical protein